MCLFIILLIIHTFQKCNSCIVHFPSINFLSDSTSRFHSTAALTFKAVDHLIPQKDITLKESINLSAVSPVIANSPS
jgi:hypothetical protein